MKTITDAITLITSVWGFRAVVRSGRTLEAQARTQDQRGVEIEFRIEGALDVLRLAKAMLFAVEQEVSNRNSSIFRAVTISSVWLGGTTLSSAPEEDHRRAEPIDVIDRGTIGIGLSLLRIRSDQPIEVARLESVRSRKRRKVAHAIVARARAEGLLAFGRKGAQGGVTAGAAAADHQPVWVGVAILHRISGAVNAVVDIRDAPLELQAQSIRTAITRAAAIVHIDMLTPRLVQYCTASERVLEADAVGPPWLSTSTGAFSPAGAVNSAENGG